MKLHAMEFPDDPARWPGWLEQYLTGLDLAALVAELEAVHGPPADPVPSVREWLGERLDAVLEGGLRTLPSGMLGRLLRQPRLLLELQELVLTSGGDYWDRVAPSSGDIDAHVDRVGARLEAFLASQGPRDSADRGTPSRPMRIARDRRPWLVGLATAASLLAVLLAYDRLRPRPPGGAVAAQGGWGWSRPDALPRAVPPAAYLDRLADEAAEWFGARPEEPIALARRLTEFRQGCSVLILSEHRPLSAEDRAWLVGKCRTWAAEIDAHLADVEAGADPLKVRTEVDATIRRLIQALRERARNVG